MFFPKEENRWEDVKLKPVGLVHKLLLMHKSDLSLVTTDRPLVIGEGFGCVTTSVCDQLDIIGICFLVIDHFSH